jgi:hypothetical protein
MLDSPDGDCTHIFQIHCASVDVINDIGESDLNSHILVLYVVIQYSLVDGCPEDGGNMLFQNVGTHISNALGRQV